MLIAGLALLVASGEFLVKGAVFLAKKMKVSSLVIGMTVVSFGTSAPELLVSIQAAFSGHADICISNIIGSNIANLALVLGLTAIVFPIKVDKNSVRSDWPMMMAATLLFYYFFFDGVLSHVEGCIFVALLVTMITWLIVKSRKEQREKGESIEKVADEKGGSLAKNVGYLLAACIGLYYGAEWLVEGAVNIARNLEVSERIIGLTIVSFGTSLPELVTSLIAAFKRETDISIGNLIGSNIFNILAILGITSILQEIVISLDKFIFDIFWMLGISILVFPLILHKMNLGRAKGAILFLVYCAYLYSVVS